jgi:nucleoside-diphosphate-sugar epimerase
MRIQKNELSQLIVSPDAKISSAVELINRNGKCGVFICEDDELVGIVMDADIRRAVLRKINVNNSIKTIMQSSPFVIPYNLTLTEKRKQLIESGKMLAPIVDARYRLIDYLTIQNVLEEISLPNYTENLQENLGIFPPALILVIGGTGYIGSVLVKMMLEKGYSVRVLDLLLYGQEPLNHLSQNLNLEFIRGDCRDEETVSKVLKGVDAVVHLGEIVGDPACGIDEALTIDTNFSATQKIVEECVRQRIKRFIFASSCSVYGHNDAEVDEESDPNPISLYARCKVESEKAILSYGDKYFCPTILRLATVHGRSFRQRFDLVVNLLAIKALKEKKIQIFGGDQWRPFLAVNDVCQGILTALQSEMKKVENQIFNLGDAEQNYQLSEVGNIIHSTLPGIEVERLADQTDKRNYRVNFNKISEILDYEAEYSVSDTVLELAKAYNQEKLYRDYDEPRYHNMRALC